MVSQQSFFPKELLLHTLFRNRYFILSKVGEGGYGSVYKARDTQSKDRLVAIKEVSLLGLYPKAMIEATTSFQREVSVLSQLDHPNLPRVYEHFQNPGYWASTVYRTGLPTFTATAHRLSRSQACQYHTHFHRADLLD